MITLPRLFLCVFLLAGLAPAFAAPLTSPLAVTPDAIGADLQQNFIAAPGAPATTTNGFIAYRKSFTLAAAPTSATMFVFADIRYILWINGQPVHRGPNRFVIPGPQYDAVEIGSALRAGSNTIAIVVMGNGSNAKMMNHATGLTLRIDIGGQTVVRTDATWKWSSNTRYRPASVSWPDIVDSIDSRVEDGDWTLPAYNDSAWSAAVKISGDSWGPLAARRIPLLRDTPVAPTFTGGVVLPVTLTGGQQLGFSMARLVQAYTVIEIDADANTQLSFDYAGGIPYYAKAGRQTYITSDSYAFSGGSLTVVSGRATIISLKFMERLYPFDVAGSFHSSDPLLDKLWNVCARSNQILSEDAYVDCADRERAEWMDCDPPSFDVTRTAMSAPGPDGQPRYADARLSAEMLRRTALTLQPDGWVKAHTCSDRYDIHAKMEDRACDWVEGARRYYESTGDTAVIREIWPVIVTQLQYFLDRRSTRGLVIGRDWVMWFNPMEYLTCEPAGLNAFVYKALVDATILGNAIGKSADANKFNQAAQDLATAYNQVLWNDADGTYYSGYDTETAQMPAGVAKGQPPVPPDWNLPAPPPILANHCYASTSYPGLIALDQDIVPADRRERVKNYLFAHADPLPRIMYYYYYWKQLYGQNQPALDQQIMDAMRQKWNGMANSAWQTVGEEFGIGSQAHCYGMFPGYFLSAYVLGVRLDGPAAAKKLIIEPRPGDLNYASGTVVTEFGPVPISWDRRNGGLAVTCTIPAGTTATLRLPRFSPTLPAVATINGQKIANPVIDGRYVVVPVTAGVQTATVSSELTWQGGGLNPWDASTVNWLDINSAASAFVDGANARFNDLGASPTISLFGSLSPAGVTVNATKNYTFGGTGSLAGAMTLTKAGSGILTLTRANSFNGGVALNGGTLAISDPASLGTGSISFAGGQLQVGANATITNALQVGSGSTAQIDTRGYQVTQSGDISSLDGVTGNLKKSGAGTLTFTGAATYAGATLIEGGTLKLGPSAAPPVTAGLLYRLDASKPASLTLSGTNVSAWNSTGGSVSFMQSTPAKQPAYVLNALNGRPVVRFSGAQQLLLSASTTPQEVVAVTTVKSGVDGNVGGFLGFNNADTGLRLNSSPGTWAPDGGTTEINGSVTTAYPANQPHVLHRYGTNWGAWDSTGFGQYFYDSTTRFYNGDVAELLVYGTALTPADRTKLRAYLNAKWLNLNSASLLISTLPAATAVTLSASGATWDLNGATQTVATLSGVAGSTVLLGGGGGLTVGDGTSPQFAGSISGSGRLAKTGTGTFTLSGASSLGGPVTVSQGTLRITGSLATNALVTIGAGATLDFTGGTLSAGQIQVAPGGTLIGPGSMTGALTNAGTVTVNGGTLNVQGSFMNTGNVRLLGGATISSPGAFTNKGVFDMMTGGQTLPPNFVNNGIVLDQSVVKVNAIQTTSTTITISITGYAGHTYQLQMSDTLQSGRWTNLGQPMTGTGAELAFSDAMSAGSPRKFYRIVVSP